MSFLLISLHFSPAYASLMSAMAKGLRELGHEVHYMLAPGYRFFPSMQGEANCHFADSGDPKSLPSASHALFANMSPANLSLATRLKEHGAKVIYWYHEPWEGIGTYLKTEGPIDILKLFLSNWVSRSLIKRCDSVMLSSQRAVDIFQRGRQPGNPTTLKIPLLFDDEAACEGSPCSRHIYFSYIGAISRSHGFHDFVRFMKYAITCNLDISFQIASRHPLPSEVSNDPTIKPALNKIKIQCGQPLSNEEINSAFSSSLCVWNLYRRSTQSGILPKALMFGSPVLANNSGSFAEFITHGVEGQMLDDANPELIEKAYMAIKDDRDNYVSRCRASFLRTFYYRNNLSELEALLR